MRKILITGALGQIGSELTEKMRKIYGTDNVVASNRRIKEGHKELIASGPFEIIDVNDPAALSSAVGKHKINTIVNLAAILSATGEKNPNQCWNININGLYNVLEIAKEKWFINLPKVGNVGAASIYLMLEELFHSNKLKSGDTVMLSVPESGRFSYAYAFLKVV